MIGHKLSNQRKGSQKANAAIQNILQINFICQFLLNNLHLFEIWSNQEKSNVKQQVSKSSAR